MFRKLTCGVMAIIGVAVVVTIAVAAECPTVEGRWAFGVTYHVALGGDTVFYGSGSLLLAASATTDAPKGQVDVGGTIYAISVSGDHAFLAVFRRGLVVVDISDPASMRVLGASGTPLVALDVEVVGNTAFVAGGWDGMVLFDVSDPASPARVGVSKADRYSVGVAVKGNLAVVAEAGDGIRLVDVSTPSSPRQLASVSTSNDADDATFSGSDLFVANGYDGLLVLDVSDPSSPTARGSLSLPGYTGHISISGSMAWVAGDFGGLHLVDISNPASPRLLSTTRPERGVPVATAVRGATGWVSLYSAGAARMDASDPTAPSTKAWFPGAGECRDVGASAGHAVVVDSSGVRLHILDPDASGGPAEVSSVALSGAPAALVTSGGKAYVVMDWYGLSVVDVSDLTAPTVEGSISLPGHPQDVALAGQYALVPSRDEGLLVVDVTHPSSPSLAGTLELEGNLYGITVQGDTAYIARGSTGISAVDISDPVHPRLLGTVATSGIALDVALSGSSLLVADYYDGLSVVDVENPSTPVLEDNLDLNDTIRSVTVRGQRAFLGSALQGLVVVDLSNLPTLEILGHLEVPGESYGGTFVGDRLALAEDTCGVVFFDVSACGGGSGIPDADFSYSPSEPGAGETVSFTDLSSGSPDSWSWSFGDGGTSTDRNPTHVFASSGTYQVALEVTNAQGSDRVVKAVVVRPSGDLPPITYSFAHTYTVPAAAHVPGAGGTTWVTDLAIHNPGNRDATVDLFFLETGKDGSTAQPSEFTVPAGETVRFPDVLNSPFGLDRAAGALHVGSDRPLVVSSRTFNDARTGTYGQYIPGLPISRSLGAGDTAYLVQLEESGDTARGFRTNLGVANVSASSIHLTVTGFSALGEQLGAAGFDVPPWSHVQLNRVFSSKLGTSSVGDAYLVVRTDTAGARWFPYASVVDNVSGDPTYVQTVDDWQGPVWIAAAAHATGYNGTVWRTSVEICAFSGAIGNVTVRWLDAVGGTPREASLGAVHGNCRRSGDILADAYGSDGAGALAFEAGTGKLTVSSRTFNDAGDRTFGQYIGPVPGTQAFSWGQTVRLVQLQHSPDRTSGFRTNVGLVNVSENPISLRVELLTGAGRSLGTESVNLGAWEARQLNDVFRKFTDDVQAGAVAVVYATSGPASFLTYASVVDNRSGDPVFIPGVLTD